MFTRKSYKNEKFPKAMETWLKLHKDEDEKIYLESVSSNLYTLYPMDKAVWRMYNVDKSQEVDLSEMINYITKRAELYGPGFLHKLDMRMRNPKFIDYMDNSINFINYFVTEFDPSCTLTRNILVAYDRVREPLGCYSKSQNIRFICDLLISPSVVYYHSRKDDRYGDLKASRLYEMASRFVKTAIKKNDAVTENIMIVATMLKFILPFIYMIYKKIDVYELIEYICTITGINFDIIEEEIYRKMLSLIKEGLIPAEEEKTLDDYYLKIFNKIINNFYKIPIIKNDNLIDCLIKSALEI